MTDYKQYYVIYNLRFTFMLVKVIPYKGSWKRNEGSHTKKEFPPPASSLSIYSVYFSGKLILYC